MNSFSDFVFYYNAPVIKTVTRETEAKKDTGAEYVFHMRRIKVRPFHHTQRLTQNGSKSKAKS